MYIVLKLHFLKFGARKLSFRSKEYVKELIWKFFCNNTILPQQYFLSHLIFLS